MLIAIPDLIKTASKNVEKIDATQAKEEIAQNNGLLIDVREPSEHAINNAVGAINIPRGVLEMKLVEIEKNPDRPIYLHCATGGRAILAAEQLKRVGYNKVIAISCKAENVCDAFS